MASNKVDPKAGTFGTLNPDTQEEVRRKQQEKKERRQHAKELKKKQRENENAGIESTSKVNDINLEQYPKLISKDEYFEACPAGLYNCTGFECNKESVDIILRLISQNVVVGKFNDGSDATFAQFNYFRLVGPNETSWNTELHAKLAYEGFFTITSDREKGSKERTPLTELQPFYSVICWEEFEKASEVRNALKKVRKNKSSIYTLRNTTDGSKVLAAIEEYQTTRHGCNWLTAKFLDMMKRTSDDPCLNFSLHVVELYERKNNEDQGEDYGCFVAGEIGFSVGHVYTSLSGFSSRPPSSEPPSQSTTAAAEEENSKTVSNSENDDTTAPKKGINTGTTQLALLGRWLQLRGYAFWSMGHCYSPQMDYKRRLGHRVLPREDFLSLLKQHRGSYKVSAYPVGTKVEIHGIVKKPELNGCVALVKASPTANSNRIAVELIHNGSMVSLKPENIKVLSEQSPTEEFNPLVSNDTVTSLELSWS